MTDREIRARWRLITQRVQASLDEHGTLLPPTTEEDEEAEMP